MRILLSTENFDAFGGMETYTRTVARELDRLGHQSVIYCPNPGTMADLVRRQGVLVLDRGELPENCDAVIAQDAASCHELSARYPDAVRLFVAHSRDHVLHEPPQLPDVCDGVLALNDRVGDWVRARAWHPPITRLRQPIELTPYRELALPASRPRRVLVTTNYVDGRRRELIEGACLAVGYEVRWIGTTSRPDASPERAIGEADIVVGLGRSALEGMAAGRAVYVYGVLGAGGWVTPESYRRLEADGFSGLAAGGGATIAGLAEELRGWRPEMGEANRDLAAAHSSRSHGVELVGLIRELGRVRSERARAAGRPRTEAPPAAADELARLLRLEWQMYGRASRMALEADRSRAERDRFRAEAADAIARVKVLDDELQRAFSHVLELEDELASLQGAMRTRRYRWAQGLAAPLDRLRVARRGAPGRR